MLGTVLTIGFFILIGVMLLTMFIIRYRRFAEANEEKEATQVAIDDSLKDRTVNLDFMATIPPGEIMYIRRKYNPHTGMELPNGYLLHYYGSIFLIFIEGDPVTAEEIRANQGDYEAYVYEPETAPDYVNRFIADRLDANWQNVKAMEVAAIFEGLKQNVNAEDQIITIENEAIGPARSDSGWETESSVTDASPAVESAPSGDAASSYGGDVSGSSDGGGGLGGGDAF